MFGLKNKVAIVTGGSSGIGAAICDTLAQQQAEVISFDVQGSDNNHKIVDVSQQEQVKQAVGEVIQQFKHIDILVNNAGVSLIGNLEETSEEDYDRVFDVNTKGVYNCMLAVVPYMRAQQGGVIINMASVAASVGISRRFGYSATKGAVRSMTYAVAKDYLEHNIRCNCISPARVHTPLVDDYLTQNYPGREQEMFRELAQTQPIGRMGTPQEIAALALYLCSDEASFITGTDYFIDGGFIKLNT
ncbi:MAG: SDR family oxidoreductase [Cyclobacteriaceae bacterium]|nr:SDR family oxidoreductase [Cyclobacteriaceae bacterium]